MRDEQFADGEVIVREGDVGDKFYLIVEGRVRVFKVKCLLMFFCVCLTCVFLSLRKQSGIETFNSPLEPWQYFGELALLTADKRQATCSASGPVRLASMTRDAFDLLLGDFKVRA